MVKYESVSYTPSGNRETSLINENTYKEQARLDSKVGYIMHRGNLIVHVIPGRRVSTYQKKEFSFFA